MPAYCHELIAATAKDMAGALYDEMMLDNGLYADAKARNITRKKFVTKVWPELVRQARATLVTMLTGTLSETLKAQIEDALIKDNALPGA